MSSLAFLGAIELGLIYGLIGLGVLLTFRYLAFPDLTVEGSFPLGGAVAAAWIVAGGDPWLALALAFAAGIASGLITAGLTLRFGILHILASILTMIALFSINIRIMGRPNIALLGEQTILTGFETLSWPMYQIRPVLMLVICACCVVGLIFFLLTDSGLALRATGNNARMVRSCGSNSDSYIYIGLGLSNGLVALGGALFAQSNGFADVTGGVGTIVVGLAAVILGETLLRSRAIWIAVVATVLGSIIYRIVIAFALSFGIFGLQASDLNLVTAALVTCALLAPSARRKLARYMRK